MQLGNALLQRIAAEFGTPCFVYDMDAIVERIESVRRSFNGLFRISYAVKSNPNRAILQRLMNHADRLDVSSGGEALLAVNVGWSPALLSFTGPGKQDFELEIAVRNGIGEVVLESVDEAVLDRIFSEFCIGK